MKPSDWHTRRCRLANGGGYLLQQVVALISQLAEYTVPSDDLSSNALAVIAFKLSSMRFRLLVASLALRAFAVVPSAASTVDDDLRPLLQRYCWECHARDHTEASIDLEAMLTKRPIVRQRKIWQRVAQLFELQSMPPEGADQPTDHQRRRFVDQLQRIFDEFDYSTVDHPGFEPIRRLTHREYNNTLRDLLGVDLRPADRFPRELSGTTGFDNAANTLSLQPSLMQRYIVAAERVVDATLPLTPEEQIDGKAQSRLFESRDAEKLDDKQAQAALRRFLARAYRQPPHESDVQRTLELYQQARTTNHSPLAAFKQTLPSVLISPNFLLRVEAPANAENQTPINDWELASRLSYFLWSSMPDEELFQLAAAATLHDAQTLQEQLERMLHDPKAEDFFASFAGQWLSTRMIGREIRRDPIDEPWCTDTLMDAMREETKLLFMNIVRNNRPLTELLSADYTFVNAELAGTLYEIEGVHGNKMRRVSLAVHNRRGILGHASVLAATSNHDETSSIKRGAYILETLLGTPPPPPPPDVAELDEELDEDDQLTFGQKLQRHADDQRCAACHRTIDPLGIALEDYGSFGRYRGKDETDRSFTHATLGDGHDISGLQGLSDYLVTVRLDALTRNLVVRTLEYALGRPVEYYDETAVRQIIAHVNNNDLTIQSLLEGVITSYPFRYRQADREEP